MAGRPAYAGQSAGFPALVPVSLNLGTALAGRTVSLRFRIGTDPGGTGPGWTIDNIAILGIDNTPFTAVVPHAGVCQEPPIASAGPDRTVRLFYTCGLDRVRWTWYRTATVPLSKRVSSARPRSI